MLEQLETVAVAAWSPDESVWARMSTAGFRVGLDRLAHHDDASLAQQLREVLRRVQDEFEQSCEDIRVEHGAGFEALSPRGREGLAGYIAAADDLAVVGRSETGATRVKRRGDGFIDVRIRPGTVGALAPRAMQREIDTALDSAARQYADEQSRLFGTWFPNGRIGK